MSTSEIETVVSAHLVEFGVTFAVTYRGETTRAFGDSKNPMDQWDCEFTSASRPQEPEQFDFYTGIGLRAVATANDRKRATFGFQGLTENDKAGRTSYGRRYLQAVDALRKAQAPHPASVLSSLLLDSSAAEQSFASWCDDFGYETDSRKALATYEACQAHADKMRRVFTVTQIEALSEALQDY